MPSTDARWQAIDKKLAPDDHPRIVRQQLDQLDRRIVDRLYLGVGNRDYDPIPLLVMVPYQYLKGRRSPATSEEEAKLNEAMLNEAMPWLG